MNSDQQITSSSQDNSPEKLKVFISYSRADMKFADELVDGLEFDGGFDVTIDRHSIKQGEEWEPRLGALIEAADTVVFVLSPDSAKSEICQWEVDEAERLKKRLVPVLHRSLEGIEPPKQLGAIHYIDFIQDGTLIAGIKTLATALREDLGWLKESTRLLNLALDWERAERRNNRLLSGQDIEDAKEWIAQCPKEADLTELHRDFIKASEMEEALRKDEERQRLAELAAASKRVVRRTMVGIVAAIVLACVASWFGWQAYLGQKIAGEKTNDANEQTKLAKAQTKRADEETERARKTLREAQLNQSKFLTKQAQELMNNKNPRPVLAALLAMEILPDSLSLDVDQRNRPPWHAGREVLLKAETILYKNILLSSNEFPSMSISFSSDGKTLVSGLDKKTVRLLSEQTDVELKYLVSGVIHNFFGLDFSPDEQTFCEGSDDRSVRLRSVDSGVELKHFKGHEDIVLSCAFSPDGKFMVSSTEGKMIRLWSVDTGQELKRFEVLKGPVSRVVFSPDGQSIISGSADNILRLWSVSTGKLLRQFEGHQDSVHSVDFSPDGKTLISGGADNIVLLWSLKTGRELKRFTGHRGSVVSVAFSSDGNTLVSGSEDKSIRLWSVEKGTELKRFNSPDDELISVAFSANGQRILSSSLLGQVRIWSIDAGDELKHFNGHEGSVKSVTFSPDGKTIVSGSVDKTVRLWSVANEAELRRFNGHEGSVFCVDFSPDGLMIVSGAQDETVRLWRVSSGKEQKRFIAHKDGVSSVSFTPDGKNLISSGPYFRFIKFEEAKARAKGIIKLRRKNYHISLWSVENGKELKRFLGNDRLVRSIALSPDGKTILDSRMRLWSIETGKMLKKFEGHKVRIESVAFSPDGKSIVIGSENKVIVWSTGTGEKLKLFNGHEGTVKSVTFSPDGKTIVSGSADRTVRLWSVKTGLGLKRFAGYEGSVNSVAFSPDGKTIVSGSEDNSIKIIPLPKNLTLLKRVKINIWRCLTKAERETYFLSPIPPRWCITGPGREREKDPIKWQPKYPYHTAAWKDWLIAKDAGKKPELPKQ